MKKLWGGRFKEKVDQGFFNFQKSIQFDYRLAREDIIHSLIHVLALKNAKIISARDKDKLYLALKEILKSIDANNFKANPESEDIHTEIQNRIAKKVGGLADKLHTLRSRNDQVAFDEKLYCAKEAKEIAGLLSVVLASLGALAARYKTISIAGYTNTQRAQRIAFKEYAGVFTAMFSRDKEKLLKFARGLSAFIGSGAIKGTILTKEYARAIKEFLTKEKEKPACGIRVVKNAPDNVSDRDFILEFLGILSILQIHLSRMAEDFILYSTSEFNYFFLPEKFCTGSSLMPHKKNADFFELARGNTGKIFGSLISVFTTMKAIPLTYNRDMQLDKEPLFSAIDIIKDELRILSQFINGLKLNKDAINKALEDEGLYATELAEYLVKKNTPFTQAHEIVGRLIRYAEDNNCKIKDMDDKLLKTFSKEFNGQMIRKILGFKGSRGLGV